MAILQLLTVAVGVAIALTLNTVHTVPEGHVAVYWRGGRLLDTVAEPGLHIKLPLLDSVAFMQTTMQTDSVREISCGTSGGVIIVFEKIEVVNRLRREQVLSTVRNYGEHYDKIMIYDKIHHEVNQFCSSHTLREVFIDLFDTLDESLGKTLQTTCDKYDTGIDIIAVRVTKPRIPEAVRRSYELIESERTNLVLVTERQHVVAKEAETEAQRARIGAEKAKMVRQIEIEKEILEREGHQKMTSINDAIFLATEKAKADAAFYAAQREAEGNALRLTPAFLELARLQALANNSKVFFGEKIPTLFAGDYGAQAAPPRL